MLSLLSGRREALFSELRSKAEPYRVAFPKLAALALPSDDGTIVTVDKDGACCASLWWCSWCVTAADVSVVQRGSCSR